jgi:hypothetical protein
MRQRLLCHVVTCAAFLMTVTPAEARRDATSSEEAAIRSVVMERCESDQSGCQWSGATVSTADERYAFGNAAGEAFSSEAFVRRSSPQAADWQVLIVQGGGIRSCDEYTQAGVPNAVLVDFAIQGLASGGRTVTCGAPASRRCKAYRGWMVFSYALTCNRARSLATPVVRQPRRSRKGWVAIAHDGCNVAIVPKGDRAAFEATGVIPTRGVDIAAPNCD